MKNLFLTAAMIMGLIFANAQVTTPQASPSAMVKQTVGLTEVTVEYARPSAKERKVFGNVVPMNKLWRTGANNATSIEFSTPVNFGGVDVKPGKYALYTVPSENHWEIILYEDYKQWGAPEKLDEKLIVAHTKAEAGKIEPRVESFSIGFNDLTNKSANLSLTWEHVMVKVPISVDPHKAVMESIKKTMSGDPTAGDFNSAASYFLENNMELKTALEYITRAVQMNPEAFWMSATKAEIQAANGDYKGAIATAQKSLELAKKADYDAYIKKNSENIEKWSKK